ncbi:hypothetical protein J4423_03560 [Candidatus Pacearchaeota archaeon]|nr:hypothetical protein [Candidatus Pacearchaeota archaeon]
MRIWSIHPKYLDSKGLLAVWRETLLAKHVLDGKTKGYKNHPQLSRFKSQKEPLTAINYYLQIIYQEASLRGYNFSKNKFQSQDKIDKIPVTNGQLEYEFNHLKNKLGLRNKNRLEEIKNLKFVEVHQLFEVVEGNIEVWEKV